MNSIFGRRISILAGIAPGAAVPETKLSRFAVASWWMLAVLFLFYAYTYVDRLVISLLVPDIKATIRLSDTAMGLVMGPVPTTIFALASFPAGWATDRFPRWLVLALGMMLFAAATIGLGLSASLLAILLARAAAAIGEATILPPSYSLIADAFPRNRVGTAIAVFSMGGKVGMASALGAGGLLILFARDLVAQGSGHGFAAWQLVFVVIGVSMIVIAPLAASFREPPRRGVSERTSSGDLSAFLRKEWRLLLVMILGFASMGLTGFAMSAWVPTYLTRQYHLTAMQYGPVLGLIGLISAAALAVKGMLLDWLYTRGMKDVSVRFYIWLLLLTGPAFAVLFFIDNAWLFLLLYGFVQIVTIPYVSYASTAIQVITPGNVRGRLMSIALVTFATSGGLGALIVGALTDHLFHDEAKLGYSLALMSAISLPLSFTCLLFALKPLRAAVEAAERRDVLTDA